MPLLSDFSAVSQLMYASGCEIYESVLEQGSVSDGASGAQIAGQREASQMSWGYLFLPVYYLMVKSRLLSRAFPCGYRRCFR